MKQTYFCTQQRESVKRYIKKREWDKAQRILTCEKDSATRRDSSGRTPLHLVCRSRPPLHMVQYLVTRFPHMTEIQDNKKRLPLHVAVESGASPQVIRCLLDANKMAAHQIDTNGKSPLHLTFDGGEEYWCDNGEGNIVVGPLLDVVELLSEAAPLMISHEDDNGVTPLEKAINIGMGYTFINLMQKKSMSEWKRMEKDGSLRKFLQSSVQQRRMSRLSISGSLQLSFTKKK